MDNLPVEADAKIEKAIHALDNMQTHHDALKRLADDLLNAIYDDEVNDIYPAVGEAADNLSIFLGNKYE